MCSKSEEKPPSPPPSKETVLRWTGSVSQPVFREALGVSPGAATCHSLQKVDGVITTLRGHSLRGGCPVTLDDTPAARVSFLLRLFERPVVLPGPG